MFERGGPMQVAANSKIFRFLGLLDVDDQHVDGVWGFGFGIGDQTKSHCGCANIFVDHSSNAA